MESLSLESPALEEKSWRLGSSSVWLLEDPLASSQCAGWHHGSSRRGLGTSCSYKAKHCNLHSMVKLSCNVKALPCLLKTAPQAPNPIQVQDDPKALYRKRDTQREVKGIKSAVSLRTARRQIVSNTGYYCLSRGVKWPSGSQRLICGEEAHLGIPASHLDFPIHFFWVDVSSLFDDEY